MLHTIINRNTKETNYTHFCTECQKVWVDKDKHPDHCTCGAKHTKYADNLTGSHPYKVKEVKMEKTPDGCLGINRYVNVHMKSFMTMEVDHVSVDNYEIEVTDKPFAVKLMKNGKPKSFCRTNVVEAMRRMTNADFPMGTILHEFHDPSCSKASDAVLLLMDNPWVLRLYNAGDENFSLYDCCRAYAKELDLEAPTVPEMLKISPKMFEFILRHARHLELSCISIGQIWTLSKMFSDEEIIEGMHKAMLVTDESEFHNHLKLLNYIQSLLRFGPEVRPVELVEYLIKQRDKSHTSFNRTMQLFDDYNANIRNNPSESCYPEDLETARFFSVFGMPESRVKKVDAELNLPDTHKRDYKGDKYSVVLPESLRELMMVMQVFSTSITSTWNLYNIFELKRNDDPELPVALIALNIQAEPKVMNIYTPGYSRKLNHEQLKAVLEWIDANGFEIEEELKKAIFG